MESAIPRSPGMVPPPSLPGRAHQKRQENLAALLVHRRESAQGDFSVWSCRWSAFRIANVCQLFLGGIGQECEPVLMRGVRRAADRKAHIPQILAGGPPPLGEVASTGTVYHVPGRYHLAMRIQHAAQCAAGRPANTVSDCQNRAKFIDAAEHIRWRLWHGQNRRSWRRR